MEPPGRRHEPRGIDGRAPLSLRKLRLRLGPCSSAALCAPARLGAFGRAPLAARRSGGCGPDSRPWIPAQLWRSSVRALSKWLQEPRVLRHGNYTSSWLKELRGLRERNVQRAEHRPQWKLVGAPRQIAKGQLCLCTQGMVPGPCREVQGQCQMSRTRPSPCWGWGDLALGWGLGRTA